MAKRDCAYCGKPLKRLKGRSNLYCGVVCQVKMRCSNTCDPKACWVWLGPKGGNKGQIRYRMDGRDYSANGGRVLYIDAYGSVPPHMDVIGKCGTPYCYNPEHLHLRHRRERTKGLRYPNRRRVAKE